MGILSKLFGRNREEEISAPKEKPFEADAAAPCFKGDGHLQKTEQEKSDEACAAAGMEDSYPKENVESGSGRKAGCTSERMKFGISIGNIQGMGAREDQEDSFAVINYSDPERLRTKGLLAVVADGMGGMEDGAYASQSAVDMMTEGFNKCGEDESMPSWFYSMACSISGEIRKHFGGMSGTTLIAVHIKDDRLHWLSVGDSAIYIMRNGGVFQLNREHTYLNRLYDAELSEDTIDKSRAEEDPDARRLTSFVGMGELKEADLNLRPWILGSGDVLLLCSDGISGVLTPPELMEAMKLEPQEGCRLLESMVLEKQIQFQDNYTAIMIRYMET